ncbi:MAG: hypothetical protein GY869_29405 [Planctomycetes bacterium]|nr:hypothetical protein [Planctomycetota bacterium]
MLANNPVLAGRVLMSGPAAASQCPRDSGYPQGSPIWRADGVAVWIAVADGGESML